MTIRLAKRVQRIKPSPTLAVTARAARLKAEGKDIIGLGAGEPDFDTPVHIADAGVAAIRAGHTRYTNVDGTNELKDAIIAKFRRDNGLEYARNQILVSSGAKQTVFNLCCALLDSGDEAIKFSVNAAGEVVLHRPRPAKGLRRPQPDRFDAVRGRADVRWRTDELMKLLRTDD